MSKKVFTVNAGHRSQVLSSEVRELALEAGEATSVEGDDESMEQLVAAFAALSRDASHAAVMLCSAARQRRRDRQLEGLERQMVERRKDAQSGPGFDGGGGHG